VTYNQRIALGGLKFLAWSALGFGLVMFMLWLPQILMWLLDR
jgi:hypothetical protein